MSDQILVGIVGACGLVAVVVLLALCVLSSCMLSSTISREERIPKPEPQTDHARALAALDAYMAWSCEWDGDTERMTFREGQNA